MTPSSHFNLQHLVENEKKERGREEGWKGEWQGCRVRELEAVGQRTLSSSVRNTHLTPGKIYFSLYCIYKKYKLSKNIVGVEWMSEFTVNGFDKLTTYFLILCIWNRFLLGGFMLYNLWWMRLLFRLKMLDCFWISCTLPSIMNGIIYSMVSAAQAVT